MEIKNLVKKYLSRGRMMQVATVSSNQPWCCTVYFVPDQDFNVYWISKPQTRHSLEIKQYSTVAAAIPVKYVPGKPVVGLQIEGDAEEMNDQTAITKPITLYAKRYQTGAKWLEDFLAGKSKHKLYKITPRCFVLFDEETYPNDPRQEWKL